MPVTVIPSNNAPVDFTGDRFYHATGRELLLSAVASDEGGYNMDLSKKIIQSSFDSLTEENSAVFAVKNGLVLTALEAYNKHHKLVLRPDDVWIAILSQLSIYVNAHAEKLRHLFVAHEGQKALSLEVDSMVGLDHGKMAYEMTKLMSGSMKDPQLRDWVLPAFTTTRKTDQTVAAIIFMGTMQKYFTYAWGTRCGLPAVTLLGEADDWALIRARCEERLGGGGFGGGAKRWWAAALRPVLDGFVASFQDPGGAAARRFWQGIVDVHRPNGSGTITYSGWITAFCYWGEDGQCLHETKARRNLLGLKTVHLLRSDVPMGFAKVPVMLFEGKKQMETEMLAGLVGFRPSRSEREPEKGAVDSAAAAKVVPAAKSVKPATGEDRWRGHDTLQPESGWFMYTTGKQTISLP